MTEPKLVEKNKIHQEKLIYMVLLIPISYLEIMRKIKKMLKTILKKTEYEKLLMLFVNKSNCTSLID